jgi:hypothetical protein
MRSSSIIEFITHVVMTKFAEYFHLHFSVTFWVGSVTEAAKKASLKAVAFIGPPIIRKLLAVQLRLKLQLFVTQLYMNDNLSIFSC